MFDDARPTHAEVGRRGDSKATGGPAVAIRPYQTGLMLTTRQT